MAEEKKKKGASAQEAEPVNQKKTPGTAKKTASSVKSKNGKKTDTRKNNAAAKAKEENTFSFGHQLAIGLIAVIAVFVTICFIFPNNVGLLGLGIANGFFGLFGLTTFLVPLLILQLALFWKRDVLSGAVRYKYLISLGVLILSAMLMHTFRGLALHEAYTFTSAFTWENLKTLFTDGMEYQGGGFLGGIAALVFICSVGYPGALIFGFLFLIALLMALFGLTPSECVQRYLFYRQRSMSKRLLRRQEKERKRAEMAAEAELREAEEALEEDDEEDVSEYGDGGYGDDEDDEDDEDDIGEEVLSEETVKSSSKLAVTVKTENRSFRVADHKDISISVDDEPLRKRTPAVISEEEAYEETRETGSLEDALEETVSAEIVPSVTEKNETSEEAAPKAKTLAWEPDERGNTPVIAAEEELFEEELPDEEENGEIMILPPDPMVEAPATED
ncbi:MAG: hypothetical protein IKD07_02345, partial [Clostridia bacterium]|nr:hypothetical protein [Clostridia bacterium]